MTQAFAAVHSFTVVVRGNGSLGARPRKSFGITFPTTLENSPLQDRRSNLNKLPVHL